MEWRICLNKDSNRKDIVKEEGIIMVTATVMVTANGVKDTLDRTLARPLLLPQMTKSLQTKSQQKITSQ